MKLFLLSSLLALAFGSNDVAVTERELLDNKYHMNPVSVTGGPSAFSIAYTHSATGSSAGTAVVNAGSCLGEDGASGTGAAGVTATPSIATTSGVTTSTVSVTVSGANAPATTGTPQSVFCVWYGVGEGGTYYGYREVLFTINWSFDGTWSAVSFTTQAYDPETGGASITVAATASDCGGAAYMVGQVICTEICSSNGLFKVASITSLSVSATGPGSFSPSSSSQYTTAASGNCMRATYLLPISWYPVEEPNTLTVEASGSVTYSAVTVRRMLQEASAATGPIVGTQEVTLMPAEESSASSVMAGAAAAAAVGAALLI